MKRLIFGLICLTAASAAAQQEPNDPEWRGLMSEAEYRLQENKPRAAESILLHAHRLAKAFDVHDPRRAFTVVRIADIYSNDQRREKARSLYEQATSVFEKDGSASAEHLSYCQQRIADVDARDGNHSQAIASYQSAIETLMSADREDHPNIIICTFGMARSARLMSKFDQSEVLFQRVFVTIKQTGKTPDNIGQILAEYARLHWAKGNLPKADQYFAQAYQHAVAKRGESHREVADILSSHSALLKRRKKVELAKQMDAKAKQIYQSVH